MLVDIFPACVEINDLPGNSLDDKVRKMSFFSLVNDGEGVAASPDGICGSLSSHWSIEGNCSAFVGNPLVSRFGSVYGLVVKGRFSTTKAAWPRVSPGP